MQTTNFRRLPVGIQTFSKIREEGYVYVDKTDLVWNLVSIGNKYNYLSRPRRFGKTLLVTTLQSYFEGRKELFEGLKIMEMEKEWKARPVIRLDMSRSGESLASLKSYLNQEFGSYENKFRISVDRESSFQTRLHNIIAAACESTGQKVAVLIDEYDFPLQHSWGTPEHEKCASTYREVFTILKADDELIRFVFITGVTKFTQISLFSAFNNLVNLSFKPKFESLCGISQQELEDNFVPEIEEMAEENGWTKEETINKLKEHYDGYHFSKVCKKDIYNPFSLINALDNQNLSNYWVSSGATTLLQRFVSDMDIKLGEFENYPITDNILESSDISCDNAGLFLYQSGYLTIKQYIQGTYILGFPNKEVRQALYDSVLPALSTRRQTDVQTSQALLNISMKEGDLAKSMQLLKALIADVPYSNKKLESMDMEERYRLIVSTILNSIGLNVEVEHMLSTGRIDVVASTAKFTYVMELKLQKNGGLESAVKQMKEKHYLEPFRGTEQRKVFGVAIELDDLGKGMTGWQEISED